MGQVEKIISAKWAPAQLISKEARFMILHPSSRILSDIISQSCRILSLRASIVSSLFTLLWDLKKNTPKNMLFKVGGYVYIHKI